MVAESPAWKPQAMLALVTRSRRASSWPMVQAPKLSPMSQLRSMVLGMGSPCLLVGQDQLQVAEMGFATEKQRLGFFEGDRCEPQGLPGSELGRLGEIHRGHLAQARIAASGLPISHEENERTIGRQLEGARGHARRNHLKGFFKRQLCPLYPEAHAV